LGSAAPCLIVLRLRAPEQTCDVRVAARQVLDLLATTAGFRTGRVARAIDDPALWSLTAEWDDVGSCRRALGTFEVRGAMASAMAGLVDEPSVFEVLEGRGPHDVSAESARQIP